MIDPEASDVDLAEQAVDAGPEEVDALTGELVGDAEADAADLYEQHRSVPLPDEDYPDHPAG